MNLEYVNEEFYSFGTEGLLDLNPGTEKNEKTYSESTLNFGDTLLDNLEFCKDLTPAAWLSETLDVGLDNNNNFSTVDWLNGDSGKFSIPPSPCSTTSSFDIGSLSPTSTDVSVPSPTYMDFSELLPGCTDDDLYSDGQSSPKDFTLPLSPSSLCSTTSSVNIATLSPNRTDLSAVSPTSTILADLSPAFTDDGLSTDKQSSTNNITLKTEDPQVQSLFDLINSVQTTSDVQPDVELSQVGPIRGEKHSPGCTPYAKPARKLKTPEQKSRKKSQNRNAATRYRIKKKDEFSELLGEANELEEKNGDLKTKVGTLQTEIDYLKSLMLDVIKARLAKNNQTVTIVTVNQSSSPISIS